MGTTLLQKGRIRFIVYINTTGFTGKQIETALTVQTSTVAFVTDPYLFDCILFDYDFLSTEKGQSP